MPDQTATSDAVFFVTVTGSCLYSFLNQTLIAKNIRLLGRMTTDQGSCASKLSYFHLIFQTFLMVLNGSVLILSILNETLHFVLLSAYNSGAKSTYALRKCLSPLVRSRCICRKKKTGCSLALFIRLRYVGFFFIVVNG